MFQPRPLEMVKSDTCLSDADKNFHEIEMSGGKVVGSGGKGGILDAHDSTIHSGHFMVSHVHDEVDSGSESDDQLPPLPNVTSPEASKGAGTKFGYDFNEAQQETAETYNFHPPGTTETSSTSNLHEPYEFTGEVENKRREVAIDASLSRLFECMTLAYNKLTSPRWKTFKGMKVNVKDKIRLNNIIWREWHMQYIKGNEPFICEFAAPLSDDVHTKPEAVVLEGKYWKRRLESVTSEYQKWRSYCRRLSRSNKPDDQMDIEMTNAQLLDRLVTQETRRIPVQRSPTPAMMDEDFLMDLAADNFFASLTSQSFMFPVAKDIGPLGNADFIQPGLFPLQPNIEDFMETMEHDLTGPLMSGASFVKSEPNLAAAGAMDFSTSPTDRRPDSMFGSSLSTLDLSQLMSHTSTPPPPAPPTTGTLHTPTSTFSTAAPPFPSVATTQSYFTVPTATVGASSAAAMQAPAPAPRAVDTTAVTQSILLSSLQQQSKTVTTANLGGKVTASGLIPHVPDRPTSIRQALQSTPQRPQVRAQTAQIQRGLLQQPQPIQQQIQPQPQQIRQQTQQIQQQQIQVAQIQKPVQVQSVPQLQTFTQTLGTVQLAGDTYVLGNAPLILQPGQLAGLLPQKPVNLVTNVNNSVKLEPDLVVPWAGTVQVQQGQSANQVIIPVRESSSVPVQLPTNQTVNAQTVASTSSILVRQLLSKSTDPKFAFPKPQPIRSRKHRNIAPAVTTPQMTASPQPSTVSQSANSPDLAQLLRRGELACGSSPSVLTTVKPPGEITIQNTQEADVNEFQKGLVLAAVNSAGFASSTFGTTNQSLASTSFSLDQSLTSSSLGSQSASSSGFRSQSASSSGFSSQSTTSSGFSIVSPPSDMPKDPIEFHDSKPPDFDLISALGGAKVKEREKYMENRRACHISAEQKRRTSIKNGFDTLHVIIPAIAKAQSPKISKAAMLQKTADYLRQLKEERAVMQAEEERLRRDIEQLNSEINDCQAQLPATGAPLTRQREDQLRGAFDEYIRTRTMQNWKFWIFSTIIKDLFTSFNSMVSTASVDELCRTILAWLDQHCSLIALRSVTRTSLCNLCRTTSILSDPARVPQQAADAVRRRDSDPGLRR